MKQQWLVGENVVIIAVVNAMVPLAILRNCRQIQDNCIVCITCCLWCFQLLVVVIGLGSARS